MRSKVMMYYVFGSDSKSVVSESCQTRIRPGDFESQSPVKPVFVLVFYQPALWKDVKPSGSVGNQGSSVTASKNS